jgi:hypothetical protein
VVADLYPPYFIPPGDPGGEGVGEKLATRSIANSGPHPLARKVDWLLRKDRFAGASVSDPDSIRSVDPDPDQGGQKLPTKIKNKKLKQSQVLHFWMFSFEGWRLLL